MAVGQLFSHIAADHLHGDMAWTFDHDLHIIFPGDFCQLPQGVQLGELRFVVGIVRRAGTQAVAQGNGYIVLRQYIADVVEMFVQKTFAVVH